MRFPDKIYVETSVGGGYDDDGFKIPATKGWVEHSICRLSVNSGGNLIQTQSGDFSKYSSLVYMPIGVDFIQAGVRVQVRNNKGEVLTTSTAIRFSASQRNCRLWV